MPHTTHIYLVTPLSAQTFGRLFAGCSVTVIDAVPDTAEPFDKLPGLIFVPRDATAVQALARFLDAPVGAARGWLGAVADEETGSLSILDVSAPPTERSETTEESERSKMSALRHSINNALTSALAETQFSLMNDLDEETVRSLSTVEQKLKQIRDIVAATRPRPAAASSPPPTRVAS